MVSPLKREPADRENVASVSKTAETFLEWNGDRQYTILVDESDLNGDVSRRTVPAGSYFVLGDHRGASLDSREFGFIPHGDIVGLVVYLYRPGDSWARFGRVR